MTCTALCEGRATKAVIVQPSGPLPGRVQRNEGPVSPCNQAAPPATNLGLRWPGVGPWVPSPKAGPPWYSRNGCIPSVGVFFNRALPPYGRGAPARKVEGHPNPVQQPYPTTRFDLVSRP